MIVKNQERRSRFIEIQPGDGTRYEFVIQDHGDFVYGAGSLMSGHRFSKASIQKAERELMSLIHVPFEKQVADRSYYHYLGYVAEKNESRRDVSSRLWTARAFVLAAADVIDEWGDSWDE